MSNRYVSYIGIVVGERWLLSDVGSNACSNEVRNFVLKSKVILSR